MADSARKVYPLGKGIAGTVEKGLTTGNGRVTSMVLLARYSFQGVTVILETDCKSACARCGQRMLFPKMYCSNACKQASYRQRKAVTAGNKARCAVKAKRAARRRTLPRARQKGR